MSEGGKQSWWHRVPGGMDTWVIVLTILPLIFGRIGVWWKLEAAERAHRAAGLPVDEDELSDWYEANVPARAPHLEGDLQFLLAGAGERERIDDEDVDEIIELIAKGARIPLIPRPRINSLNACYYGIKYLELRLVERFDQAVCKGDDEEARCVLMAMAELCAACYKVPHDDALYYCDGLHKRCLESAIAHPHLLAKPVDRQRLRQLLAPEQVLDATRALFWSWGAWTYSSFEAPDASARFDGSMYGLSGVSTVLAVIGFRSLAQAHCLEQFRLRVEAVNEEGIDPSGLVRRQQSRTLNYQEVTELYDLLARE
jgi:hypothetical protein